VLKQFTESKCFIQFLADKDTLAALAGMEIPDRIKKEAEAIAKLTVVKPGAAILFPPYR